MLATFWLAMPMLAGAHTSHAHRYCAEHRTVEEGAATDERATADDVAADDAALLSAELLTSASESHDECLVLAAQARTATLACSADACRERVWCSDAVEPRSDAAAQQISVLAVAPKSSPPAC